MYMVSLYLSYRVTIVKFTQLCSKFLPIALLNIASDWLALNRDISSHDGAS